MFALSFVARSVNANGSLKCSALGLSLFTFYFLTRSARVKGHLQCLQLRVYQPSSMLAGLRHCTLDHITSAVGALMCTALLEPSDDQNDLFDYIWAPG